MLTLEQSDSSLSCELRMLTYAHVCSRMLTYADVFLAPLPPTCSPSHHHSLPLFPPPSLPSSLSHCLSPLTTSRTPFPLLALSLSLSLPRSPSLPSFLRLSHLARSVSLTGLARSPARSVSFVSFRSPSGSTATFRAAASGVRNAIRTKAS
jgi:hypothetical protein